MIFSNTAVRSLSSLLVFAIATTTPSGVGGATTTNRKLSKNTASPTKNNLSSTAPPTSKCPTAPLFYSLAINNTIGSPHTVQAFPGPSPLGLGEEKICHPELVYCVGDTYTKFQTLYSDRFLTQQVATLTSTAKVVNINDDGEQGNVITSSIVYQDVFPQIELNYGAFYFFEGFDPNRKIKGQSVSGGTQECALTFGTVDDLETPPGSDFGAIRFNLVDLKMLMNANSLGQPSFLGSF